MVFLKKVLILSWVTVLLSGSYQSFASDPSRDSESPKSLPIAPSLFIDPSFSSSSSSSSPTVETLDTQASDPSKKRTERDFPTDSPGEPPKKQVYARPTYDSTMKYLLEDDEIRLDFVRTFTGIKGIESTQRLDEHINPLHRHSELRTILGDPNLKGFFNTVSKNPSLFSVIKKQKEGIEKVHKTGTTFIQKIAKHFNELRELIPSDRNSQLDILCKLSDKSYVAIEVQVSKENYWDKRALSYLCSIFSRQLSQGEDWSKIQKVIGINILGGGPQEISHWEKCGEDVNEEDDEEKVDQTRSPIRHYKFQDSLDPKNLIEELQLIQYSLPDVNLGDEKFSENPYLKDWLDYLKNAHTRHHEPEGINSVLQKAYERIRFDNLPKEVKDIYIAQDESYQNFSQYTESVLKIGLEKGREEGLKEGLEKGKEEGLKEGIEKGKEEGKQEEKMNMARVMLAQNLDHNLISTITGLTVAEIESLK